MKTFPKFLKTMPSFWGLGMVEIAVLMAALYLGLLLSLHPFLLLVLLILAIGLTRLIYWKVDLKILFLWKREIIEFYKSKNQ